MSSRTIMTATAVALCAASASADSVTMTFDSTGLGRSVRVASPDLQGNVFAGQLFHRFENGTGLGAQLSGRTLATYCIELAQNVATSPQTFAVTVIDGPTRSPVEGVLSRMVGFALSAAPLDRDTNVQRDFHTAVQLAIWEVITDFDPGQGMASLDVQSGSFHARKQNGDALWGGVMGFVGDLFDAGMNGTGGGLAMTSSGAQDQVIPLTDPIIPAPTAAALGLAGLGGMASRRRRA